MSRVSHPLLWAMALAGIVLGWTRAGVGQSTAAEAPPAAGVAVDEEELTSNRSADDDRTVVREQSIYIPYEKLRKVFEKEGRGVFLPYEKFRQLWEAAQEKTAEPAQPKPPVAALITEIDNEATVSEDVVRVRAVVRLEILAEGWSEIPLRLSDAAITSAVLGGRPARIVSDGSRGYKLLVNKEGPEPEQVELTLEYAKAISRAPGQNSVSLEAPQAPVSRWRVRIPEAGVKVSVHPLIAATEVLPGDPGDPDAPAPGETMILAFVGAAPTVRIEWTPKAEGAAGLEALASVQGQQQVTIDEGVIRTRTQLTYTISRAELGQLAIEVPAGQKVVNVFDANVRQWSVEEAADRQIVTVQLFEPAKGSQGVTVELEEFTNEDRQENSLVAPVVKALNVGRQQGVVVVQLAEGLRAEATRTGGLLQVDAAELPGAFRGGNWAFSYRYATVPFDLELSVEKVQPRITVDSLVEARLEPERLTLDVLAVYTIERAGVFRLELDVPAGYEVRQVRGREAAGAAAVRVDAYHLEGDDETRLVVNLARKALGRVALAVELHKELEEPDLLTPTGQAAAILLTIPRAAPESVEQAAGRLVILAPESLRVNPAAVEGLRSISFTDARDGMQASESAAVGGVAGVRPVLAFAYTEQRAELSLSAERRKPQVTVRQLLAASIEEGVVKYRVTLFYSILYSDVKSLRIDVPAEVAALLRIETASIRHSAVDPAPEDLGAGDVAWSLSGETELIGEGKIELVWEEKLEKLEVGGSVTLAVPRLAPKNVDRAWGQIVLVKTETIDVHETGDPSGLRPIDPQHDLMPGAQVAGAARAFEFHEDWSLELSATRYELEEVKHTSIERAVLRMVVTRAEKIAVQALYRMRSAQQRLVVKLPGEAELDSEPRINGRQVTLEVSKNEGEYLVPLVDLEADKSFLLEIRYTVPDKSRLDGPEFPAEPAVQPLEPAVQKVYLCAYLPRERVLLDTTGPWTDEFDWLPEGTFDWEPHPLYGDEELLTWVADPIELGESFPTDGRLYVFSALRPAPAPKGSLQLKTVEEDFLSLAVLAVVGIGGLVLLPAGLSVRAAAGGVLLIGLVVCGVFYPIFARQVLDGVLVSAVLIVLVVWVVWYLARSRTRYRAAPTAGPVKKARLPSEGEPAEDGSRDESPPTDGDEGGQTDA